MHCRALASKTSATSLDSETSSVAANSDADKDPQTILSELRVDIDRIDADVHRLLMERGEIIVIATSNLISC